MNSLYGEYEIKIDPKGRIMLPATLKKQLPEAQSRFIINKGFEKCLVLYPFQEWEKINEKLSKLNPFVAKNRILIRKFNSGLADVQIDSNNRLLIPKNLLEYAGIEKDIVLFAYGNKIEIWDKATYEAMINDESNDLASLAEDVLGNDSKNE